MTIEFRCSQCNQLLRVPDTAAGKNARCPKCQALMLVPAESPAASPPPMGAEAEAAPQGGLAPMPSDPFAPLGVGGAGGKDGTPPSAPPPKHPFGEVVGGSPFGGQAASLNPYAPPSAAAQGYQPQMYVGGRPGLPWDVGPRNFSTWWETTKLCMMQPSYAYSIMWQSGGIGQPMMFAAIGLAVGTFGQMLWYVPLMVVMMAAGAKGGGGNGGDVAMMAGIQVVTQLFTGVFTVALGATVGLLIGAGILHVCLMIVGGANRGYEATLRVVGYAQGSTSWLNVIPCGALVAFVSMIAQEIIGLWKAHETTSTKAVLAVVLPMLVCMGCAIALIAIFLGAAGAAGAFGKGS